MYSQKIILFVLSILISSNVFTQEFKKTQLQNGRVEKAYWEKGPMIMDLLRSKDLDTASLELFIRVLKMDNRLEIWGRDSLHETFILIKDYRICRISGEAGPKRKQGDLQIPEGIYHIDRFNPWSNFHLSLGINYPNASDRILSDRRRPGGGIFIHGSCVTIGCVPLTDDMIKEVYILAVEARNSGQEFIPVHIFPLRMEGEDYESLLLEYRNDEAKIDFWRNIEEAYLYFENNKLLPDFSVNNNGSYCFK